MADVWKTDPNVFQWICHYETWTKKKIFSYILFSNWHHNGLSIERSLFPQHSCLDNHLLSAELCHICTHSLFFVPLESTYPIGAYPSHFLTSIFIFINPYIVFRRFKQSINKLIVTYRPLLQYMQIKSDSGVSLMCEVLELLIGTFIWTRNWNRG